MATLDSPFPILKLPIEVRWVIYRQLLFNFSIHPCPSVELHSGIPPRFLTDILKCASHTGSHQTSSLVPICSPKYLYTPSDVRNLMLVCSQIHLELEPLVWTNMNPSIGLWQFNHFFHQDLDVPLRSALPNVRARHQILQKLTVVLPRINEPYGDRVAGPPRSELYASVYVRDTTGGRMNCMSTLHPELQSIAFVMDEMELQPDSQRVICLPWTYVDWMLRFKNLRQCTITYSGASPPRKALYYMSKMYRKQLDICEQILKEMVTSTAADPIESCGDCPTQLIEQAMFNNVKTKPIVREYCERVARRRNQWWSSLSVTEQEALVLDETERKEKLREHALLMERWMLAIQI